MYEALSPFAMRFAARWSQEAACGHFIEEGGIVAISPQDERICGDCADTEEQELGACELYQWARDVSFSAPQLHVS